jgi:hypothetical protein
MCRHFCSSTEKLNIPPHAFSFQRPESVFTKVSFLAVAIHSRGFFFDLSSPVTRFRLWLSLTAERERVVYLSTFVYTVINAQ